MFSQAYVIPSVHWLRGSASRGVCLHLGGFASRGWSASSGGSAWGGLHPWEGGSASRGVGQTTPSIVYYRIQSMSRQYASYWNAFLLLQISTETFVLLCSPACSLFMIDPRSLPYFYTCFMVCWPPRKLGPHVDQELRQLFNFKCCTDK